MRFFREKKEQLQSRGFCLLAGTYAKGEEQMLENCLAHLRMGGVEYEVLNTPLGAEVWRTIRGFKFNKDSLRASAWAKVSNKYKRRLAA